MEHVKNMAAGLVFVAVVAAVFFVAHCWPTAFALTAFGAGGLATTYMIGKCWRAARKQVMGAGNR